MASSISSKLLVSWLVALVVATAMVPMASAQGTAFVLSTPTQSPTGPIQPDTGEATINVPWSYRYPPGGFLGQTANIVQITWTPSCSSPYVLITGAGTQLVSLPSGQETVVTDSADFKVSVTQDAPGEQPIGCTVTGRASELFTQVAPATESSSVDFNVVAAYLGLISVNVPSAIIQAGPQKEIRYELEVLNLGNSRSLIAFDLVGEQDRGWRPVLPTPLTLESRAQGGSEVSRTVNFQVSTPFRNGWNNDDTTFQLRITPTSLRDGPDGQAIDVSLMARVRGVYVPMLEPLVMLGAVLATGLVARRMHSNDEGDSSDTAQPPL